MCFGCKRIEEYPDNLELINLDFENQSISPWEGQYNDGNFQIVQDNAIGIHNCGKFVLNEGGDYWISPNNGSETARSEIQVFNSTKLNTTMYYAWDLLIPEEYAESDDWQVIGQFHDQPDISIGETWITYPAHSPPISVKYKNGNLIIAVYSWESNGIVDIAIVGIEKGKWNKIKLKISWSVTENGSLQAWLNNTTIESPSGQTIYIGRNSFNKACNYFKIGIYRSKSIMSKAVVYYDNIISSFYDIE